MAAARTNRKWMTLAHAGKQCTRTDITANNSARRSSDTNSQQEQVHPQNRTLGFLLWAPSSYPQVCGIWGKSPEECHPSLLNGLRHEQTGNEMTLAHAGKQCTRTDIKQTTDSSKVKWHVLGAFPLPTSVGNTYPQAWVTGIGSPWGVSPITAKRPARSCKQAMHKNWHHSKQLSSNAKWHKLSSKVHLSAMHGRHGLFFTALQV